MEDIAAFARSEKSNIWKFHFEMMHPLSTSLKAFKKHELNALLFLTIEKPIELCRLLRTSFFYLEKEMNHPVYKHYSIEKKKGGTREIFAPGNRLKLYQKTLNYFLQAYYLWIKPEEVHGFVINPNYLGTHCNIVENAKVHTNKRNVLNIDLKDFFPNIPAYRVKELFSSPLFEFNEPLATALTLVTTFQGKLPIGAPTSPVISNFICLQLDRDLKEFCNTDNLSYTRYADDLTFSSDLEITTDTILDIINLINKNDFQINEKKLRLKTSGRRQIVTGLTVNEKVNVDRKLLKKIRAMLHDFTTNGLHHATKKHFKLKDGFRIEYLTQFMNRLEGYINFVGQVRGKNDPLYRKFRNQLKPKPQYTVSSRLTVNRDFDE
jgi:RNA-directed DNA polymerase